MRAIVQQISLVLPIRWLVQLVRRTKISLFPVRISQKIVLAHNTHVPMDNVQNHSKSMLMDIWDAIEI